MTPAPGQIIFQYSITTVVANHELGTNIVSRGCRKGLKGAYAPTVAAEPKHNFVRMGHLQPGRARFAAMLGGKSVKHGKDGAADRVIG